MLNKLINLMSKNTKNKPAFEKEKVPPVVAEKVATDEKEELTAPLVAPPLETKKIAQPESEDLPKAQPEMTEAERLADQKRRMNCY